MFDGRTTVASMSAERTETDFVPSASPTGPELPDMSGSYNRYISSGLYDRRYPRPNRRTLRIMQRFLPAGGRFLDVGAGTGRYTLPLLHVDGASGLALDICPVARKTLAERFAEFVRAERLHHTGRRTRTRLRSTIRGPSTWRCWPSASWLTSQAGRSACACCGPSARC